MKKQLLCLFMILFSGVSFGQITSELEYLISFEDTSKFEHLVLDSTINHNNLWQIGRPQKQIFTSAFSPQNVIVTDTINTYPVNDTSIFEVVNIAGIGWCNPHTVTLSGNYYVDSDSLTDYGRIEVSPNNGADWVDIINDTNFLNIYAQWWPQTPILTGRSNGWQDFEIHLQGLASLYTVQLGDTILFRFTFISDSIQTNRDGLMFDDLRFEDTAEGIEENEDNNLISIFPNPVSNEMHIRKNVPGSCAQVQIMNCQGQTILNENCFTGGVFDTGNLSEGLYLLKYSDGKNYCVKQFVVVR